MHHIAQLNIARMRAPLEDPLMADFVAALAPVNARAESSPGFVWRLETADGDATAIRAFDDPNILINMSVWASVEDLRRFIGDPIHARMMRGRASWFLPMDGPYLVLWWVPRGTRPTPEEGRSRLARLAADGPGPEAFTFRDRFPAPGGRAAGRAVVRERPGGIPHTGSPHAPSPGTPRPGCPVASAGAISRGSGHGARRGDDPPIGAT